MGHRFKHTGDFVPGSICEACGAGLDHPEHDTTPGEEAAEDAEKAKIMREVLQAERDVAISRVRELYHALGSGDGGGWSDAELTMALEKIASLRNHARVADETIANVRREHDLAKTRVTMLRDEVDSQRRKNDEAYIEIETLRRLMSERESPLSPPVTEPEAALLRLVRQYGCIDESGNLDAAKAQSGLDFITERQQAGRMSVRTPTAFDLSTKRLLERAALSPSGKEIVDECFRLAELLVEKNIAYADSALTPKRIFSKMGPLEQIKVRIDDKLSRIGNGNEDLTEDTVQDLIGYLVLYRIGKRRAAL